MPPSVYVNPIFQGTQQKQKIHSYAQAICTVSLCVAGVFEILWTNQTFSGSQNMNQDIGLDCRDSTLALQWE